MAKKNAAALKAAKPLDEAMDQQNAAPEAEKSPSVPAVKDAAPAPMVGGSADAWGTGGISAQDIIIPRILLMQPMSEAVTAGDAAFGDFRESLSMEKLGDFKEGFEVVPFALKKVWVEYDVTAGTDIKNKKFLRVVDINPSNENLPYEDEEKGEDGKMIKVARDRTMNFYVLPVKDLELESAIPHVLSFRRSGLKAGKALATQMYVKNISANKTPASVVINVEAQKETEEGSTWAIPKITPLRPAKVGHVEQAFKWLSMVNAGRAKEDTASYNQESAPQTRASGESVETGPMKF
jgi:hypothetical protein